MKTYIISLTTSHERRAHMTAQMEKAGITDYEFIDAETKPNPTEGCMKSHRKVWQLIADSGNPGVVLEDDVNLHDSFYHFMATRTRPEFTQYIEVGLIGYQIKGEPLWNNLTQHWRCKQAKAVIEFNGAYGYLVNCPDAARKLLKLSEKVKSHPDLMMMELGNTNQLALFFMNFALVLHGGFPSTLNHNAPQPPNPLKGELPPKAAETPAAKSEIRNPKSEIKTKPINTKGITITLLHPSRGRAAKAKETLDYWLKASSQQVKIEHILSIDSDDPQAKEYSKLFAKSKETVGLLVNSNDSVVMATNHAAKKATGNILVYLSDDFKCPEMWDVILAEKFNTPKSPKGDLKAKGKKTEKPMLLQVGDGINAFGTACLTIPIMNRALYKKLGYFWHPDYKSMFVDEDLYWTTKNNGWLVEAPELTFEHEHPANNKLKVPSDATYQRSSSNWNSGQVVYLKRKEAGFPLK